MICAHDDDIKREKKMKNKPKAETAEVSVTKIMLILEQILIIFFVRKKRSGKVNGHFHVKNMAAKEVSAIFKALKSI